MNKKIIWIVISLIIILLVVVNVVLKNNTQGSSIKIGAVIPVTGVAAYWGEPVQRGIALAQETIDQKFGPGAVKIIVEDGKSNPKDSVSAASKLLSIDNVNALYSELSAPSAAVAPLAKSANKVFYYGAFNPKVVDGYSNSVKGFISFADACDYFGKYFRDNNIQKVAILNQFSDVAPSCVTELKQYLPESNILLIENLPTDNDFRTILLQVKSFGSQAVIGMTYESGALVWIKQMYDLGINLPVFSGDQDALTQKVVSTIGANKLNGSIYFAPKVNSSFSQKYMQMYPNSSASDLQPAAYVNEAMINLAEVMTQCKSDVSCVTNAFNDRISDVNTIIGTHYVNRVLSSTMDYYQIKNGTSTLLILK